MSYDKYVDVALNPKSSVVEVSNALKELKKSPTALASVVSAGLNILGAPNDVRLAAFKAADLVTKSSAVGTPAYHNLGHMVDVAVGYIRLANSEPGVHISFNPSAVARYKSLGLVAAIGHDLGHPGGSNAPKQVSQIEKLSVTLLAPALERLKPEFSTFVCNSIEQTDHMAFMQKSREDYLIATTRLDNPQAIVNALLRQADLYRSTSLTPEDALESGALLKKELLGAGDSNCPHLKGLGFVDGLDTPAAQKFFTQSNPCVLSSIEGNRCRQQMAANVRGWSTPEVAVELA